MSVYGEIPGVRIETSTGGVPDVTIGRESYLILVGVGTSGTAPVNEAVRLPDRDTVVEKFGENSDITVAFDQARANGANPDYIRGVRAERTSQVDTNSSASGTLQETPVPDKSAITASIDSQTSDATINFVYEQGSDIAVPSSDNVVNLNPVTSEYEATGLATDGSIEFEYDYADWSTAIDTAGSSMDEAEFGVIAPLTLDEDAGLALQSTLTTMREDELKMAVGLVAAEPNKTVGDEKPGFDTTALQTRFADDTIFSVAGTALADRTPDEPGYGTNALGAAAGLFAGNPNTEPVYDNTLAGVGDLAQRFSRADVTAFRDNYIIPLRDNGTVRVAGNHSTYDQATDGGWERDFFRRRIVDLTTVTAYQVSRQQIGGILTGDVIEDVEDALSVELGELVGDDLLQPGGQSINAYRADKRTIGLDLSITPFGVAKAADVDLSIIA